MRGGDSAGPAFPGPDLAGEELACRRGERLVFAGLSFRLGAGEALVLTGTNGSGKSSLLRLLATLLTPASGRLLWGEAPVRADLPAYRARCHYVGHLDAIKPTLTPRETLMFWAALHGRFEDFAAEDSAAGVLRQRQKRGDAVAAALTAFALDTLADSPCRWLSAGQRRRLALARLFAVPAPVWLLDEPNAALDGASQERLEQAIAAHRAAGGRLVVATHLPIAVGAAEILVLDDFAPAWDPAWDRAWEDPAWDRSGDRPGDGSGDELEDESGDKPPDRARDGAGGPFLAGP